MNVRLHPNLSPVGTTLLTEVPRGHVSNTLQFVQSFLLVGKACCVLISLGGLKIKAIGGRGDEGPERLSLALHRSLAGTEVTRHPLKFRYCDFLFPHL